MALNRPNSEDINRLTGEYFLSGVEVGRNFPRSKAQQSVIDADQRRQDSDQRTQIVLCLNDIVALLAFATVFLAAIIVLLIILLSSISQLFLAVS